MLKRLSAFVLCVTLLAACAGPSATQSVTKAGERSGGLFGLSKTESVTAETGAAFKGVNEAVVGSFVVGFATKKTDSAKAGGGLMGSGFGGKSTARCDLTGLDDATMQRITDAAYAGFKSDMEAKGIRILDRAALVQSEPFQGANKLSNPHEETQGGLFGTKGITKYFAPSGFDAILPFMGDIAGVTGGFGFSNPMMAATKYVQASGQKVLHVVYVIDFANTEKYGGWATSTSNVNVGQGLSVIPGVSKIGIIGGEGGTFSSAIGSVTLGQPATSDIAFAEVVDSTTEGEVAMETAANIIGVLGGVGSNKSRSFEFKARPADFERAAIDALTQADARLTDKIASLR